MRIQLLQWGIFPVTCAGYMCYPYADEALENTLLRLSLLADSLEEE